MQIDSCFQSSFDSGINLSYDDNEGSEGLEDTDNWGGSDSWDSDSSDNWENSDDEEDDDDCSLPAGL